MDARASHHYVSIGLGAELTDQHCSQGRNAYIASLRGRNILPAYVTAHVHLAHVEELFQNINYCGVMELSGVVWEWLGYLEFESKLQAGSYFIVVYRKCEQTHLSSRSPLRLMPPVLLSPPEDFSSLELHPSAHPYSQPHAQAACRFALVNDVCDFTHCRSILADRIRGKNAHAK